MFGVAKAKAVVAKKPNRVIYAIAATLMRVFFKVTVHMQVDRSQIKDIHAPYLLLCNHISNLDFLIVGAAMYPQKLNYMTAALYFQNAVLAWLLTLMGCFPKQQFVSDIQSVRNIMRITQRGDVVVIFPSGQSSFTGQSTLIEPSIAKLIRMVKVPVITLHTDGAHIGFPKWNMKAFRATRVQCCASVLFTPQQIEAMSDEQIYQAVVGALAFDDYEWQREHRIAARHPRLAEGLEQLLFVCPACHSEFETVAQGSLIRCARCGNQAKMDEYGLLSPVEGSMLPFDTPTAWYRWQQDFYRKQLQQDFRYAVHAKLSKIMPNGKLVAVGEAEVSIDLRELRVKGTAEGQPIDWALDNGLSGVFAHEKKFCFEVMAQGQLYAIAPDNPRAVFKFILLKEELYRMLRLEHQEG